MGERRLDDADVVTAIGVISGTSMDGIDVAVVRTDGDLVVEPGAGLTIPYPDDVRGALVGLVAEAERALTEPLADLEQAVTDAHIAAIETFMAHAGIDRRAVSLIGLHGQTVYHRPDLRFTRQLGFGAEVARRLGIDTVNRFRHADVEAGGEGAPFAPLYHRALASGLAQPLMVLNLGGVANVTYLDGDTAIAFDSGPASALLDDFVMRRRGVAYDRDGALAASGRVDEALVAAFMENPFFARRPPKSLDRNDFHRRAAGVEALSDADGAATLAAFTVESVAASLRHVPAPPARWLVTGGGRHNAHLMGRLRARLGVAVEPVEAVGWHGDFLEAEAFAYLAVRARRGLPLSLPTTTGVPHPMPGGELHRAG
ncbi:anhydro-N-acetylmuramic acid kinase [Chelatococcus asaccharovorans]|uniref:anhydro-N-acetylmuramic acid kinase n=1 Tax=Chelatococcus asaccharovorans TaxID=28210 RepID=UPI00224C658C|nr:anhydro-N-acetylmuramic acid kinase [Chelatococcus asaccharovorans]CAH1668443.1 Anhydro-N-acetylmuramic acid kinase [Chelatococcus asaccharovorans]CAH1680083.1 Anhydro-N-acetylmuramic acid kinase [Chelatococcus asaccharovorans]